ncbi:MAG: hypothetical protein FWD71_23035 [Oscillospiraceae bacterium]|nr:hypothetical protein [Oscillospiraceae bacterium]
MKNLTGQRFGKLLAVRATDQRKGGSIVWECKCDCGKTAYIRANTLNSGGARSCGCERDKNHIKTIDLTGQRFGRLLVVKVVGKNKNQKDTLWECKCDCGNTHYVTTGNLNSGTINSCGCLKEEALKIFNETIDGTAVKNLKRRVSRKNTTGVKGVYIMRWRNVAMIAEKYAARITFKGKQYHLGTYEYKDEAVKARREAEQMLFEPFLEWYDKNKKSKKISQ